MPNKQLKVAMKLASAITLGPWTLAQSTSTGLRLAPDALPIWAKEPRSDVAFHNVQISTVHGVLLYPTIDGVARCGWLGAWAMAATPARHIEGGTFTDACRTYS